jgi:hypothetical protein
MYVPLLYQAILLISVLLACATAPINMLVDFLFEDIILAPSADEYKVELQSRQMRARFGRQAASLAATTRGVIRKSISMARNSLALMLPVSMQASKSKKLPSRLSSTVMEHFTVPDASIRTLPPSVVRSYASTSMILKDVFGDNKEPASEMRTSIITPHRMSRQIATDDVDDDDDGDMLMTRLSSMTQQKGASWAMTTPRPSILSTHRSSTKARC